MRKVIYLLAVIGGLAAAFGGPALGLGLAAFGRSEGAASEMASIGILVALAVPLASLACGISLAWAGLQGLREAPGRVLRLPHWFWWLLAAGVLLWLGWFAAGLAGWGDGVLPVLHIAVSACFAFLFLSLATGAARARGARFGARSFIGSLDWGALGAVLLAMLIEVTLLVGVVLVVALWLGLTRPDLAGHLQEWALQHMQNPGQPPDLGSLRPLVTSPVVILLGILGVAVAVPFVEEFAKSLAVPLIGLTRRPDGIHSLTRLDAFLAGVAAGAGFALLENILNGSLALANPETWWALMGARGATTAIHCLATGLAGLAWQAALTRQRWGTAAVLALAAGAVHGAWNLGTSVSALAGLFDTAGRAGIRLLGAVQVAMAGMMAVFWFGVVLAIPAIAAYLAAQEHADAERENALVSLPPPAA